MKEGVAKVLVALLVLVSVNSYAEVTRKALIDFNVFEDKMKEVIDNDASIHQKMLAEPKNFAGVDLDYTKYGYKEVKFTAEDWALKNWQVVLASSARTVKNNLLSYCLKITNSKHKNEAGKEEPNVLGVRVHFPNWRFLSWAMVKPPYEFYVYHDNGRYVNEINSTDSARGKASEVENTRPMGVLINVGQIKEISSFVYGLYYPHGIAVRLKNRDGIVKEYFLGNTLFRGWRKLVWMNPEYVSDIRDRDLKKIPLYPQSYPHVKFEGFVIYKPENQKGGDYISYYRNVWLQFDRAIVKTEQDDIEDEDYWKILSTKRIKQKREDLVKISETIYLRQQEKLKMGGTNSMLK